MPPVYCGLCYTDLVFIHIKSFYLRLYINNDTLLIQCSTEPEIGHVQRKLKSKQKRKHLLLGAPYPTPGLFIGVTSIRINTLKQYCHPQKIISK